MAALSCLALVAVAAQLQGSESGELSSMALSRDDECHNSDVVGPSCSLVALQSRAKPTTAEQSSGSPPPLGLEQLGRSASLALSVYQWNPHWQCLMTDPVCKTESEKHLNDELVRLAVDFANVIELDDAAYTPPSGFKLVTQTCNKEENAVLIYDARLWRPSKQAAARASGCMRVKDRAFNVQAFHAIGQSTLPGFVVVGAHYPHDIHVPILKDAIAKVRKASGYERVLFIADTNQEQGTSIDVAVALEIPGAQTAQSSPMYESCCYKTKGGFKWDFDRIITNFGKITESTLMDDPVPSWAASHFHKGVHVTVQMDEATR